VSCVNYQIDKEVLEATHTLFILCGLPYAGKSHVVNELLKQTSIELVSIDRIFTAKGYDWDTQNLPTESEWSAIFAESYAAVRSALEQGKGVLYDSTNQTKASRDALRAIAAEEGANVRVLYVKTPIETIWKRWEENQRTHSRPQVSRALVQMTIDMFEEPNEDENVIVIENE
jgi:predicted kinase